MARKRTDETYSKLLNTALLSIQHIEKAPLNEANISNIPKGIFNNPVMIAIIAIITGGYFRKSCGRPEFVSLKELCHQRPAVQEISQTLPISTLWPQKQINCVRAAIKKRLPIYVYGPPGCGKTYTLQLLLAEEFRRSVFEMTCSPAMEVEDLFGKTGLRDGNTYFEDGLLSLALRHGHPLILNELDFLRPTTVISLQALLERREVTNPYTKERYDPFRSGFYLAATGNTFQGSDLMGAYQGTRSFNEAFADRFMVLEISYPDPQLELTVLIEKVPSCSQKQCEKIIQFMHETRKISDLPRPLSIRGAEQWALMTEELGIEEAFEQVILPKYPHQKDDLSMLFRLIFG